MSQLAKLSKNKISTINLSNNNDYDITKDKIFNAYANNKLPDDLDYAETGIAPYTSTFGAAEAKHLLNRTLFGHDKATLDMFAGKTMSQAVDALLNTNSAISEYPKYWVDEMATNYGTTWHDKPFDVLANNEQQTSLAYWLCGNIVFHDNTKSQEKLNTYKTLK